jgi:hypothetical protein
MQGAKRQASTVVSKQELLEFAAKVKDDLGVAVKFASSTKARRIMGPSTVAGLYYLFREKNAIEAHAFFEQLGEGAGLAATDPILHLRDKLQAYQKQRGRGVRLSRWYFVGLAIKAWNKRRAGLPVRSLYVGQGEAFPSRID